MTFDLSRRSDIVIAIVSPIVLLLAWQVAVGVGFFDKRFVPAPLQIAGAFGSMVASGELLKHILVSLGRVAGGLVLGVGCGVVVGLTMGIFRPVRAALTPIVAALFPISKLAILPILILFFGIGELSKVMVIAIGVFFISVINTVSGVINIDRIYLDVAKNLGVSGRSFYLHVAIPGALPAIVTGGKVSMGVALLLIVAAEFVRRRVRDRLPDLVVMGELLDRPDVRRPRHPGHDRLHLHDEPRVSRESHVAVEAGSMIRPRHGAASPSKEEP